MSTSEPFDVRISTADARRDQRDIRADEAEAELALIAELVGFDPEGQLDLLDAVELAIRPPGPGSLPGLESAAFTLQLLSETERLPQHERHWLDLARAIVWRAYNDKKTAGDRDE